MNRILVIQTAFIGDVILATALLEKLHQHYPNAKLDILLRKGNESLFVGHPFINECLIWDKQNNKYKNLLQCIRKVRLAKYDVVVNCQRYAASGLIAGLSSAKKIIGFSKNPLSFLFDIKIKHEIGNGQHEIERNQMLIADLTDPKASKPKLYPRIIQLPEKPYVCVAPASVWATKQLPVKQWITLCQNIPEKFNIVFLGGNSDQKLIGQLIAQLPHSKRLINRCGTLNLLESAVVMQHADMNYVNDSAPLHLASAVNAPVCAFFCSTIPEFGFGPLSDKQFIIQAKEKLDCRPCGLHGKKTCPEGHFKCGSNIDVKQATNLLLGPV
ncbi:MAG: glycosyltransferase family 9 protein [Flavobacteriales bacterium]